MRELDFERPVLEIERQIEELRRLAVGRDHLASVVARPVDAPAESADSPSTPLEMQIAELEERARALKEQVFSALTRWQMVQLARHPERPYTLDYIRRIFRNFIELHGDRGFGDDASIVGGLARIRGQEVMLIGHQKGRTTAENMKRNFGMPRPEGYRKALRLMKMADRFGIPVITLIDTPGAFPGLEAEERGQAQAIAEALEGMAALKVPVISTVIGEGGSGGALAIGVANRILMLEYSTYSVISPEGCASILFKDASHAAQAADALRLTAPDLLKLGIIDQVVPEPFGGAHRDRDGMAENLAAAIVGQLNSLRKLSGDELAAHRYERFRTLGDLDGVVQEVAQQAAAEEKATAEETEKPA